MATGGERKNFHPLGLINKLGNLEPKLLGEEDGTYTGHKHHIFSWSQNLGQMKHLQII